MNQSPFSIPAITTVQVTAALEPLPNQLLSLWALTAEETLPVDPWITQSAAQISPEQRHFNQLLFTIFGSALLPKESYPDLGSYLSALALQPATVFQERLTNAVQAAEPSTLRTQAEQLLTDPTALRQQISEHLRQLWNSLLAPEWQRHRYTLAGMTRTINDLIFSQPRWQAANPCAALRFLLQSEPSDPQLMQLAGVRRIVLVFSPHLLGHCTALDSADTLWLLRKFDPQLLRRDPLQRAEVLGPLAALADDTRLRILELLSEAGEQRAQDLIAQLESSQGNVSRHLKQLVGAGLISERRADGANKLYQFDQAGLALLHFRLRQLLSSYNAQSVTEQAQAETQLEQIRSTVPPILQKFLDEQGRITRWSSKLNDQQAMMEYLIEKFAVEQGYSEKQVNDLLRQWYLDADFVLIRRSMIDAGILKRTKDGARYWREG